MINSGVETFICLCMAVYSVLILKLYLDAFFEIRGGICKTAVWSLFFAWQYVLGRNVTCLTAGWNLLLTLATLFAVIWFGYGGDKWKKWVIGLLFLVLWMSLEAILQFGFMYLGGTEGPSVLLLSVLSKVLLCILVLAVSGWVRRRGAGKAALGKERWMILLLSGSVALYYVIYKTGQAVGAEQVAGLLAMGAVLIMLLDLSLYPAYVRLTESVREKQNSQYYIRQMENYRNQKAQEEAAAAELREVRHDLKQKLIYARELSKRGEQELLEQAFSELIGEISQKGRLVCETGNPAVDAMVNCKAKEVSGQGGSLHMTAELGTEIGISDTDMSVLLGNALDNASEALSYVDEGEREIWLDMKQEKGLLFIRVKNRYDGKLERDGNGRYKSRKREKGHGVGYQSMEKIVKKYQGEISAEEDEAVFTLNIVLYCQ